VYGFALLVALILMIVVVCVSIVGESGAFKYALLPACREGSVLEAHF
jgi:hypothetical protein